MFESNFFIFLGILLLVHSGYALRCYNCSTKYDPECGHEKIPEKFVMDCPEDTPDRTYTMCRKIVQRIDFSVNENPAETRIIRKCGWYDSDYNGRCYLRSGFGGRQEVCSCLSDECNGASVLSVKSFLPLILVVGSAVLRMITF